MIEQGNSPAVIAWIWYFKYAHSWPQQFTAVGFFISLINGLALEQEYVKLSNQQLTEMAKIYRHSFLIHINISLNNAIVINNHCSSVHIKFPTSLRKC